MLQLHHHISIVRRDSLIIQKEPKSTHPEAEVQSCTNSSLHRLQVWACTMQVNCGRGYSLGGVAELSLLDWLSSSCAV